MAAPSSFSIDFEWDNMWALYTVYPLTTAFFWAMYFAGPRLWPRTPVGAAYMRFSAKNKMLWQQNTNAMMHAVGVVILLIAAVLSDRTLRDARPLHAYTNHTGLAALCFSMGYFSFAVPWSWRLYFCKKERGITNLPLCIHHPVVLIAALSYVLGRTSALYGAVCFICMEFNNWPFILHILLKMVKSPRRRLIAVAYASMIVKFVIFRIAICTWMLVLYSEDLGRFASDSHAEWAFIVFQYLVFVFVYLLSWVFAFIEVKPVIDAQLAAFRKRRVAAAGPTATRSCREAKPGRVVRSAEPGGAQPVVKGSVSTTGANPDSPRL